MEDDSFRQESPVNTSKEAFFFPEFDLNKFSSCKSFLDCFDQQCLEYQKDEQWKKQNIPRYLTGVYLKFWYENHLFEKSYQTISEVPGYQEDFDTLRMDLNDATINRSNTDSADRKPVDTGSYTRWNHAYGSVHRGTDAQNRFQSRGNHGQPHQSHMMRFSGRQQNRHNLYSPRNETNQRQG
ncbi:hypothetical protein TNCV_2927471 [Trichonephila clavipes]|nr:hypothetical protein TNCV_2927471 [Trichonephila clavipes]